MSIKFRPETTETEIIKITLEVVPRAREETANARGPILQSLYVEHKCVDQDEITCKIRRCRSIVYIDMQAYKALNRLIALTRLRKKEFLVLGQICPFSGALMWCIDHDKSLTEIDKTYEIENNNNSNSSDKFLQSFFQMTRQKALIPIGGWLHQIHEADIP